MDTAGSAPSPSATVANGANVEIEGASAQSVTFAGMTGALKLDNSLAMAPELALKFGDPKMAVAKPTIASLLPNSRAVGSGILALFGTATPNSIVEVFDGTTLLGT